MSPRAIPGCRATLWGGRSRTHSGEPRKRAGQAGTWATLPRSHDVPVALRADDGTRTRDPHLGKAQNSVHGVGCTLPNWTDVVGVSTESAQFLAVVERSTTERPPNSLTRRPACAAATSYSARVGHHAVGASIPAMHRVRRTSPRDSASRGSPITGKRRPIRNWVPFLLRTFLGPLRWHRYPMAISANDQSNPRRTSPRPPLTDSHRLVFTVAEAGELLGISRAFAYVLVARGELPVIRLGRRLAAFRKPLAVVAMDRAASDSEQ